MDNRKNQDISIYETVQINDDQNDWGHEIRKEIIGKKAVVLSITHQSGNTNPNEELKYYVYVPELKKTYGISVKNLESLEQYQRAEDLVLEFSCFFLDVFSYFMGYARMAENSDFFSKVEMQLINIESTVDAKSISLCLDFALKNVEKINREIFIHNEPKYSDELVREYLTRYQASFKKRVSYV